MEEMLQFLFLEEIFDSRTFMKKNDVEHDWDKEKKTDAVRRRLYFHLKYSSTTVNLTLSKPDTTDVRTWILRDTA